MESCNKTINIAFCIDKIDWFSKGKMSHGIVQKLSDKGINKPFDIVSYSTVEDISTTTLEKKARRVCSPIPLRKVERLTILSKLLP